MKLLELRGTALEYFQKLFPNMPKYVVQDWIYKNFKNNPSEVKEIVDQYRDVKWKQEVLDVTLDTFEPITRQFIEMRIGGAKPAGIPKDVERHETQKRLLGAGPSQEPIIVAETPQGYELIEGWHRTIQSLQMWPEGYKQKAWIGYK